MADKYHIGRSTIQKWVAAYKAHGLDAFICGYGNASYTSEFKTMCVEEVLSGYGSSVDIGAKYKVHPSVLESWIRMYNANRKLKDYDLKREVYMAEARRKTTIEERKKSLHIVLNTIVIIRVQPHSMMFLIAKCILG